MLSKAGSSGTVLWWTHTIRDAKSLDHKLAACMTGNHGLVTSTGSSLDPGLSQKHALRSHRAVDYNIIRRTYSQPPLCAKPSASTFHVAAVNVASDVVFARIESSGMPP